MCFHARQAVDQPGINGSGIQFPLFGKFLCPWHLIKHPADLRRGEIRIDAKSGLRTEQFFISLFLQGIADVCRLARLPDDGIADGKTSFLIPDDSRFTLICNADTGDLRGLNAGFLQAACHN